MEIHGTQNSQNNLEKKNKFGVLILLNLNIYYKATLNQIVWSSCKGRQIINGRDSKVQK